MSDNEKDTIDFGGDNVPSGGKSLDFGEDGNIDNSTIPPIKIEGVTEKDKFIFAKVIMAVSGLLWIILMYCELNIIQSDLKEDLLSKIIKNLDYGQLFLSNIITLLIGYYFGAGGDKK